MNQPAKFCSNCGAALADSTRFCPSCGQPVQAVESGSPAPPSRTAAPGSVPIGTPPPPPPAQSRKWLIAGGAGAILIALAGCLLVAGLGVFFFLRYQTPITAVAQPSATPAATAQPLPDTPTPAPTITASATALPPPPTAAPLPTATVAAGPSFNTQGVRFSYDPSLAVDIKFDIVPAATGADLPPWEQAPDRRVMVFNGYPAGNANHIPQIIIYPVQDYLAVDPGIGDRLATLQQMLLTRSTANLPDDLPFFPTWNAAQIITAQVQYLDFKNGAGVRYLTQYGQDVYPINNQALFYTFQGLTSDNRWLISAVMPVSNSILPDPDTLVSDPSFYDTYPAYLESTIQLLEEVPPSSYQPGLALLDQLFRSLEVN